MASQVTVKWLMAHWYLTIHHSNNVGQRLTSFRKQFQNSKFLLMIWLSVAWDRNKHWRHAPADMCLPLKYLNSVIPNLLGPLLWTWFNLDPIAYSQCNLKRWAHDFIQWLHTFLRGGPNTLSPAQLREYVILSCGKTIDFDQIGFRPCHSFPLLF